MKRGNLITKIEWTDKTWNITTGCTKVSAGCKNCYAEKMAKRLHAMEQPRYRNGFDLTLQPDLMQQPLKWKKPRKIFVNSMSDLFHDNVPTKYLEEVFETITQAHWHEFQMLTKRPHNMANFVLNQATLPQNAWFGTSVENQATAHRIHDLMKGSSRQNADIIR